MATSFDRWEKDPFFSAAEEVQESADRYGIIEGFVVPFLLLVILFWTLDDSNVVVASPFCRLESIYWQWIQERKQASKLRGRREFASAELHRELRTALGTAKWQVIFGSHCFSQISDFDSFLGTYMEEVVQNGILILFSLEKSLFSSFPGFPTWMGLFENGILILL